MKNILSIDEMIVDLRSSTRWDLRYIENYQAFKNKNHEFENIRATFSYNSHIKEIASNEEDWDTFKNYIASDFSNLKYPPCHLYVERNQVEAIWFIPDLLLINGIGTEEKLRIMKNMEKQLLELMLCKLEELVASEGDRGIEEDLYLENYRKKQFLNTLRSKDMKEPNDLSAKGES